MRGGGAVAAAIDGEDDEEEDLSGEVSAVVRAPLGMGYLPVVPNPNEVGDLADGVSHQRDAILDVIREFGYDRPAHNLARQREEQRVYATFATGEIVHRDYLCPR